MKHLPYDEWLQYVKDEVNENSRRNLKSHLYSCDQCLRALLTSCFEHMKHHFQFYPNERVYRFGDGRGFETKNRR